MKKTIVTIFLALFALGLLSACGGGGGVYYRGHYGHGAWRGYPGYGYIDRRPIIVPPHEPGFDRPEAVHLPEHPIDMGGPEAMPMEPMMDMDMGMDMGMPEIDFD